MFEIAALAVGLLVFLSVATSDGGGGGSGGGAAVALRARAREIVREVVASQQGDAKFARLGWVSNGNATSCGALPGYLGVHLGDPTGITRWGVEGARTQGQEKGAWVVPNGHNRPGPGDILGLCETPGGILVHVCVIDEVDGNTWTTADAGQGPSPAEQATAFVVRTYDPHTNGIRRADGVGKPRFVAGWISLPAWPFPSKKKALLEESTWQYPASDFVLNP